LEKDKIAFIDDNWNFIFFLTLRVTQTTIQLKNKYIAGYTTRNTKFFLIVLRFVQPTM